MVSSDRDRREVTGVLQRVTVIPGDGIGPEITSAVKRILEAADTPLAWEEAEAGLGCINRHPNGLPEDTLATLRRNQVALKGPTATPKGGGHKSVNVTIRKTLELYANVRPIKSLPGVHTRFEHVDLVIVRENVEDTYGGIEHQQTPEVAQCLKVITRPGSLAAIRYAFDLARSWGRKRVTCVHKANIHKITDGLFLTCFREVAASYPDVAADDMLVDNTCMQLVTAPERFDVLVMPNLYGDILSDLAAGLVGGLGVAPGGNIGNGLAVFEAVHGTAPDVAGKGLANPTALLLSAIQMLRYLGLHAHAERIEEALTRVLASGVKTRDLGGTASTDAFTQAIIEALPPMAAAHGRILSAVVPQLPDPPSAAFDKRWETRGVDLFIECPEIPSLPEQIGKLRLKTIANRGTKIYPGPRPESRIVDWHCCRFLSEDPISDQDLLDFLKVLSERFTWMHVEKLRYQDGYAMFSMAQGE